MDWKKSYFPEYGNSNFSLYYLLACHYKSDAWFTLPIKNNYPHNETNKSSLKAHKP